MRAATLTSESDGSWSYRVNDEHGKPYARGTAKSWEQAMSDASAYLASVWGREHLNQLPTPVDAWRSGGQVSSFVDPYAAARDRHPVGKGRGLRVVAGGGES